jgi:mannose PTS system EIIA component
VSVQVVLITHEQIGDSFKKVAQTTLNQGLEHVYTICVTPTDDPETIYHHLKHLFEKRAPQANEFLLLTDIIGATPCNIATRLLQEFHEKDLAIVTGLNLAMLLKVLNYQKLSLNDLQKKAIIGGKDSITERHCKKD